MHSRRFRLGWGALMVLALAGVVIIGCHKRGGNGKKGKNHELTITAVAPESGPEAGGTDVLIVGFNFQQDGPVTDVLFGAAPAASFIVQSNNQIDAVTPAHLAGVVDVTLRNAGGDEARLAGAFEFLGGPTCIDVTPPSGPATGGTSVTIRTSGFTDDFMIAFPEVLFDGVSASSIIALSADTVRCITPPDPNPAPPPAAPRPVDVTVISQSGQMCTLPGGFTYLSGTSGICMMLNPTSGTGGSIVTITSSGICTWGQTTEVFFGPFQVDPLDITFIDPLTIEVVVPQSMVQGPVDVTVTGTDPNGAPCSCTIPDGFTYR